MRLMPSSFQVQSSNTSKNCKTEVFAVGCAHADSEEKNTCKNIPLGTPVDFKLKLSIKKCKKESFMVQPVGLKDQVSIHS